MDYISLHPKYQVHMHVNIAGGGCQNKIIK